MEINKKEFDWQEFITDFREEFEKNISTKTGWGKNELMIQFDRTSVKILAKVMQKYGVY